LAGIIYHGTPMRQTPNPNQYNMYDNNSLSMSIDPRPHSISKAEWDTNMQTLPLAFGPGRGYRSVLKQREIISKKPFKNKYKYDFQKDLVSTTL
jgi:hypothetical protein